MGEEGVGRKESVRWAVRGGSACLGIEERGDLREGKEIKERKDERKGNNGE